MIGVTTLTSWLRELRAEVAPDEDPIVQLSANESEFAWQDLSCCTNCGHPGIDVGQDGECRYSTDGPEGLHAHVFVDRGVVNFHLDEVDPCRDPIGHALKDTSLVAGGLGGAAIGLIVGGLAGGGKGAAVGAIIGGGFGAAAGANFPRRKPRIFQFRDLLWRA